MKSGRPTLLFVLMICLSAGARSASQAAEAELVSLDTAIAAINAQAAEHPFKFDPLTRQQVLTALGKLAKTEDLSDEHFQQLQAIAKTERLPPRVTLRQFLRYDDHNFMQHGWWVKLLLQRDTGGAFGIWIRKDAVFSRPYTQKERQFREEVKRDGGMPTIGRLVTYFDEDPKFNQVTGRSADYEKLVSAARAALDAGNVDEFLTLFYWEGADGALREFVKREITALTKRNVQMITVERKRFQGELIQRQGFVRYGSNLPVEGYLDFVYAPPEKHEPPSLRLEMGEHQGQPRFVCHVVKEDQGKSYLGKRLSKPITVTGFISQLPDGWYEVGSTIDAPDEMPGLRQANLELWRMR